jgi:DNA-binding SARP family transcriptional activator
MPLVDAVTAIAHGSRNLGMLCAFAGRFSQRTKHRSVEVRLLETKVLVDGVEIAVPRRELELLFALSTAGGSSEREKLAAQIWPEQTTDAARNSLKVYLARLRSRLGSEAIVSARRSCALAPHVRIDLVETTLLVGKLRRTQAAISGDERRLLLAASRSDHESIEAHARDWEWFAPMVPQIESLIRDAAIALARDASARCQWSDALEHARHLLEKDPTDETACETVIRSCRMLGDNFGAVRALRSHAAAIKDQFGADPASHLQELVT